MAASPPDLFVREFLLNVERWFRSDMFLGNDLDVQAAYLNLCLASFLRQPTCVVPNDDALLWALAGCASIEQWRDLRERVLRNFEAVPGGGLRHPIVLETYEASVERILSASRAGSIGGQASAQVRRARKKAEQMELLGTTVERDINGTSSARAIARATEGKAVIVPAPSLESDGDSPMVGADAPRVPDSWSGRFCADWKEIVSGEGGTVPGGNIGNSLRGLVQRLTEERVRPIWQHYLRTEPRPMPRFFAENFAKWEAAAKAGRGIYERPSLADRNAAVGADWEREVREGRR